MIVGAQTFTIRDFMQTEADFTASMKKIADIGYTCVQLSAFGPLSPTFMKKACEEAGLAIVLTHTNPERMLTTPQEVIHDHEILGCDSIGIGMMPERYRTPEMAALFARDFAKTAEMFHQAGKKLFYHHHSLEWERDEQGTTMLDLILNELPPDLLGLTLDTYWVQSAGADVCDTIVKYQDRLACVHLKDMAIKGAQQRMAVIGEGNLPFLKILDLLDSLGTTNYLLVEQDLCYGEDPFDCLKRSFTYLQKAGFS